MNKTFSIWRNAMGAILFAFGSVLLYLFFINLFLKFFYAWSHTLVQVWLVIPKCQREDSYNVKTEDQSNYTICAKHCDLLWPWYTVATVHCRPVVMYFYNLIDFQLSFISCWFVLICILIWFYFYFNSIQFYF